MFFFLFLMKLTNPSSTITITILLNKTDVNRVNRVLCLEGLPMRLRNCKSWKRLARTWERNTMETLCCGNSLLLAFFVILNLFLSIPTVSTYALRKHLHSSSSCFVLRLDFRFQLDQKSWCRRELEKTCCEHGMSIFSIRLQLSLLREEFRFIRQRKRRKRTCPPSETTGFSICDPVVMKEQQDERDLFSTQALIKSTKSSLDKGRQRNKSIRKCLTASLTKMIPQLDPVCPLIIEYSLV